MIMFTSSPKASPRRKRVMLFLFALWISDFRTPICFAIPLSLLSSICPLIVFLPKPARNGELP
jgi:hypothetical protein